MATKFEITEYYELVALHKALHVARFARQPLIPALPGSPYLANIAKRIVEVLAAMEVERGKPERANDWRVEIDPNGEVWQITVRNAADEPDLWNRHEHQKKIELAHIFLSPFIFTEEIAEEFVRQVDIQAKK